MVTTENWNDTRRYSVGFDYQYTDKIVLRSGVAFDETSVPSAERRTARIPGNDRKWLSFGQTYLLDEAVTLDVSYSHLYIKAVQINNEYESSIPTLASTQRHAQIGRIVLSITPCTSCVVEWVLDW